MDAEGCFNFISNRKTFTFVFSIGLHIDDANVLEFIKERLNVGKVYYFNDSVHFKVVKNSRSSVYN